MADPHLFFLLLTTHIQNTNFKPYVLMYKYIYYISECTANVLCEKFVRVGLGDYIYTYIIICAYRCIL